jgi:tetratricopeptide (TPR) repeat protein
MRQRRLLWAIWALSFSVALRVHAAPGDPAGYTDAVNVGLAEFEDKNFAEARAQFARAHALSPSARTLRALGMVEFELKRYAESARLLSEALSSKEKPLDADKRAHVEQLLERASGYIGKLTLDIEADTSVTVDGVTSNLAPGNELVLEVGDHTLEFQSPTRIAQKRAVTIRGGELSTLRVRLTPLIDPQIAGTSTKPADDRAKEQKERRAVRSPWLWTAVGIVVAGAATGAAIAITRDAPAAKTAEAYSGTGGSPPLGTPL